METIITTGNGVPSNLENFIKRINPGAIYSIPETGANFAMLCDQLTPPGSLALLQVMDEELGEQGPSSYEFRSELVF